MAPEGPARYHRVRFIKEYESELTSRAERDDVSLHSYIISVTDASVLVSRARVDEREEFHNHGVYFEDDGVGPILSDVIEK